MNWFMRCGEMCWVEGTQSWLFVRKVQSRDSIVIAADPVVKLSGEFLTCHSPTRVRRSFLSSLQRHRRSSPPLSPSLPSHSPRIMGREVQRTEGREKAQILKWSSANVLPELHPWNVCVWGCDWGSRGLRIRSCGFQF